MATYQYQGRDLQGSKVAGQVDAPTEELAAEALISKGVIPTSIRQGNSAEGGAGFDVSALFTPSLPMVVFVIF